jgi:hypothetical protein
MRSCNDGSGTAIDYGRFNKLNIGQEAKENDIEGKSNNGQDKMENGIIAVKWETK